MESPQALLNLATDDAASATFSLRPAATLPQAAASQIRAWIVSGNIAPGTLLRETALAQELGISATPVREALGMLASEGLVEIEAHRLKRAAPIDLKASGDLIRVQGELWRLGYQLGMPRIHDRQRDRLEHAVARYRAAIASGAHLAAIIAGLDFHTIFISASDNRELLRLTLDRRGLIARFIYLHALETMTTSGLEQHEGILRAFHAGDFCGVLARLNRMERRLLAICNACNTSDRDDRQQRRG